MSQSPDWKKDIKDIIMETVPTIVDEKLKVLIPPKSTPPSSEEPIHQHKDEHPPHTLDDLLDCPDCAPKVINAAIKKEKERRKELELECENCGTGVRKEETECVFCGGTEAKARGS